MCFFFPLFGSCFWQIIVKGLGVNLAEMLSHAFLNDPFVKKIYIYDMRGCLDLNLHHGGLVGKIQNRGGLSTSICMINGGIC